MDVKPNGLPTARTDFERIAVAKRYDRQVFSLDFDESEVGRWIGSDNGSVECAVVVKRYFKLLGSFNHMVIGNDISVSRNDYTAAESHELLLLLLLTLRLLSARATEKEIEEGVGKSLRSAGSSETFNADHTIDCAFSCLSEIGVKRRV